MCLYPRLIRNMKYRPNKKNGGQPPVWHDHRVLTVPVGCGKCIECRKQKSREWQVRLQEEIRHSKNGKFVTLTFSNESIKKLKEAIPELEGYELDNAIAKLAMRRFLERWRKEHKKSVKHWMVTELGHNGTENIHMHGIIWTDKPTSEISKHWQYGWIWDGKGDKKENYVNEKTVNYIVKYISKTDQQHKEYKSKVLTSPGIGAGYKERKDYKNNSYKEGNTREYYQTRTGHKISLPIYYRNARYTDEEKEKLWLEKLDKQERYILGQRIDISQSEEIYYKQLNIARNKNKRLGYGDNETNWDRKQYEHERRVKLQMQRIAQANTQNGLPTHTTKSGHDDHRSASTGKKEK